jgi:hypothetical protein
MARDPRLRPFRIALWVVYLTVVAVAIVLTVRSVVKNLQGPSRPSSTLPTREAVRVCLTELERLHREQNERAWHLGADLADSAGAVQRWQAWSHDWEQRLDDLGDRCRLDAPDERGAPAFAGRRELAAARDAVLAVHRAYSVQVNRFAQDAANLARAAADALKDAQAAVSRASAAR